MGELLGVAILLIVIGIGSVIKHFQEAKARAERERQRLESRTSAAPAPPPPFRAAPQESDDEEEPAEAEEPEEVEEPAEAPREAPVVLSPLEEFRRFVKEAQDRQRRAAEGPRPVPPPVPRAVGVKPAPRPPVRDTRALGVILDAQEKTDNAERDDRFAQQSAPVAAAPAPEAGPSLIENILGSDRPALAKAIIVRELLGPPLARRRRGLPVARG